MRICAAVLTLVLAPAVFGQAPIIRKETIWMETVKRGDLPVSVRGRGLIGSNHTVELQIPEALAEHVQAGHAVSLDTRPPVTGRVKRVGPTVNNGVVPVLVDLEGTLPESARPGATVEGMIHITTLSNVVYMGRPVGCRPNSEGTVFKLEPGGQGATRVKVRYGQFGHTPAAVVEVRQGLEPGDQVILTDMSAHAGQERVRLE